MIKSGIVGMGFMGWIHWLAYRASRGIRVAALCTREPAGVSGFLCVGVGELHI